MEVLNPLRSVHGRGTKLLRAYIIRSLIRHEGRLQRSELEKITTPKSISRVAVEAREAGVIDDNDRVTPAGEDHCMRMISGFRDVFAEWLEDELSMPNSRVHAERMILDTKWLNIKQIPDKNVDIEGSPGHAATLVQALNEEYRAPNETTEEKVAHATNSWAEEIGTQ